jgi:two-component system phosphate regulon sensor histidine kinase PhoR
MELDDYRLLLAHSSDIHWMLDCATGRLLYVSPAAASRLGCAPEQALVRAQVLTDPLLADVPARLARFRAGDDSRRTVRRETVFQGITVEIESTLANTPAGFRLVGTVRDISERAEVERQQKKFVSMVAHEFRTPLATIDGAIQRLVMTGGCADEGTQKRYHKIQGAVDRLLGMIDDYLSPERLAGIGRKRPEEGVAPAALLEAAAGAARARHPGIAVHVEGLPSRLRADPQGMRLCLDVLLDNAIKYTPPGSAITLSAGRAPEGGVDITVTDDGPVIGAADLGRLFDKGYRGVNAADVPGSGLGLYMAKAVVEVHGGTLTVENLPERGKKFRIWLPLVP